MQSRMSARRATLCVVLSLGVLAAVHRAHAQAPSPSGLDAGAPAFDGGPAADASAAPVLRALPPSVRDARPLAEQPEKTAPDAAILERTEAPEGVVEVTVVGNSKAQRTRESSQAVTVVELDVAKRQSADLGEVLTRVQGIHVRRQGGLGSNARFSLNGLTDDQVRFALDDVPLELAGFPQGIANVPLLMLDRVEIYRGVVPIRFGADALGGLVNLVTPRPTRGRGAGASYQVGSFGTHRATLYGYNVHKPTGLFTRLSLYADYARNDYDVGVDVADPTTGQLSRDRVERFHDRYRAFGGAAEVGVVKRSWADRLVLRAFAMRLDRDLQHDLIMATPYGEARYDVSSYGGTLRYEHALSSQVRVEALVSYAYQPTHFDDTSAWIYDWYGRRIGERPSNGETSSHKARETLEQHAQLARVSLQWRPAEGHELELSATQVFARRDGEDHLVPAGSVDPAGDRYQQLGGVAGVAWEANVLDDYVENTLFGKAYFYRAHGEETRPNGLRLQHDRTLQRLGGGDALRVRITRDVYAKASYEYTTRLPRPDEVFGERQRNIDPSVTLRPESSHNGNLELTGELPSGRAGRFRATASGFYRRVQDQIILIPSDRRERFVYRNLSGARARGVEGGAGWTLPGDYVAVDGNMTYVDLRNTSTTGPFSIVADDRVPNRPYLFANTTTHGQLRSVFAADDLLSLTWYMRYTHSFFRSWESLGLRETKAVIPTQLTHALVLGYLVRLDKLELGGTLEAQNLTDARVFDNWGVEKPGRAFYLKLSASR